MRNYRLNTPKNKLRSHNAVFGGLSIAPKKMTLCTRCNKKVLNILRHGFNDHKADYINYFKNWGVF